MSAAREGFNLFNRFGRSAFAFHLRPRWIRRMPWRLVFEDTFMPLVCAVLGHKRYNVALAHEPEEWGCRRCHQFIK